jgi:hypothetical protein
MQSTATVLGLLRERGSADCRVRNCLGRCSARSCICWPTGAFPAERRSELSSRKILMTIKPSADPHGLSSVGRRRRLTSCR